MDKPTNQQSFPCPMPAGFIKVHRSLRESWVARDPHHLALWTWLMMLAAFKPHSVILNGIPIKLEPGEIATSLRILAGQSGMKRDKVKAILKNFESHQMIRHWPNNKYTRIRLINWTKYQADPTQVRHRPDTGPTGEKKGKEWKQTGGSQSKAKPMEHVFLEMDSEQ
jgi:hypothetical protein